ncbi:hypothetical protein BVX98_02180, partial [bacterium F11]
MKKIVLFGLFIFVSVGLFALGKRAPSPLFGRLVSYTAWTDFDNDNSVIVKQAEEENHTDYGLLSPDGMKLAFQEALGSVMGEKGHELRWIDVTSRKEKTILKINGTFDISWSPDGQFLAVNRIIDYYNIYIISPEKERYWIISTPKEETKGIMRNMWSRDGKHIHFFASQKNPEATYSLYKIGLGQKEMEKVVDIPPGFVRLMLSPNENRILGTRPDDNLWI